MESELVPTAGGINGINLDNYFPNRRSYNSVVYFHKKFLPGTKKKNSVKEVKKAGRETFKNKVKKKNNVTKQDKSQQFNEEVNNQQKVNYETFGFYNDSILEQTFQFAKNLVPLVIPAVNEKSSPVIYTIKTKKHKKHDKKPRESSIEREVTYRKEKKQEFDAVKKCKNCKESYSAKESIDPSSQNTLDDIHLNINQSCSFSEATEIKYQKKEPTNTKVRKDHNKKIFVSDSFEALATESLNGFDGNKIKVQLMNESDKCHFCESIKNPIVESIKEHLSQMSSCNNLDLEVKSLQKIIQDNNQKLGNILEKLACLEKKIDTCTLQSLKEEKPLRIKSARKVSALEYLEEDIKVQDDKSEEEQVSDEEYNMRRRRNRSSGKSVVVSLSNNDLKKDSNKKEALGCGEKVPDPLEGSSSTFSQLGIKPERPNRLPARFCWTDADGKK